MKTSSIIHFVLICPAIAICVHVSGLLSAIVCSIFVAGNLILAQKGK